MELQYYLTVLRKRWRIVVAGVLTGLLLTAGYTWAATPQYQSQTQFFVSVSGAADSAALQQGSTFTQQRVASYAQLLTSPRAMTPVRQDLARKGIDVDQLAESELAGRVAASSPPGTVLIDVTVTDSSPRLAQEISAAVGVTFPDVVADIERPSNDDVSPVSVSLVRPATVADNPVSPNPVRNLALGAVLGLLLGLGAALLRHMLDTTVRTTDDVKELTEVPVIGAVHFDPRAKAEPLIVQSDQSSPRSEAFRSLRTNLMFVNAANHPRTILLTSSIPGEGKSTTLANLALTLAKSGSRVCVVEADLRRPRLMEYLGMEGAAGLTDVLIGRADLEDVLQPYGTSGVQVLGAGPIPPNPSELLASEAMTTVLGALAQRFDYVLIDTPPVLPVTDAVVLSTKVDGVLTLIGTTIVRQEQLRSTMEALNAVDNTMLGLVLNRVGREAGDGYSAYGYYGYSEKDRPRHAQSESHRELAASRSTSA